MDNKKKIAIVSNTMCVGGVEIALIEMLKAFDYQQYQITLYLREPGGEFFAKLDHRIEVRYWGQTDSRERLLRQLKSGHWLRATKGLMGRIYARQCAQDWARNEYTAVKSLGVIDGEYYDGIIAYHGATPGVLASALYGLKGGRRIAWIHGKDSFPCGKQGFWANQYCKFDKIICVSLDTQDRFVGQYPATKEKTCVCYNLLDTDRVRQLSLEAMACDLKKPALVTVGRLAQVKGQKMIPSAVRQLSDAGYDIRWYLVGDGELRCELEEEIIRFGVQDRVILLGMKENPYPYIKNCDIYVQPSFSEGYCTTTVEAKILQKPIVTTDAPGMREQFVSGENGLIVDAMTPEALAGGIATLLDHPEMREKFVGNLKKESFDNSKELQKLYDFIEN